MTETKIECGYAKKHLLPVVLGLVLIGTAAAQSSTDRVAGARAGADDAGAALEEIVVTAQRRTEALQETPLAVTAISGELLQRRNIVSVEDLGDLSPGVSEAQQNGINHLYIRGVGMSAYSTGMDPSTAFSVDGVVIGRPSAQLSSFYDLDQIEVLRGPQGTLYGRNATSGSVNLITRKPTDELSGYIDGTFGNYSHVQFDGALSGPLDAAGDLKGRIAFQTIDHDGYGENVVHNTGVDDEHARAVRATLEYDKSGFDVTLVGDYSEENDRDYAVYGFGPFIPGTKLLGQELGGYLITGSRDDSSAILPENRRHNSGVSVNIGVDLSDKWRFQSITGYRDFWRFDESDVQNSSYPVSFIDQTEDSRQISQELHLLYTAASLKGIVGLYYYHENLSGIDYVPFLALGPIFGFPSAQTDEVGSADINAFAAFTQWTYQVVDGLNLTAGVRYSHEHRESEGTFTVFNFSFPPANIATPVGWDRSYDAVTPRFVIDYTPVKGVLVYASATRGFKSGVQILGSTNPPVDPEYIWSYETGTKLTMFDNRLEMDLTGFVYDYSNLQINRPEGLTAVVVNAASAQGKGVEFEVRARPVRSVTLNFDVSYLDAKFTNFPTTSPVYTSQGQINLAGNTLPNAPEWTVNGGVQVDLPVHIPGTLSVRADANYTSEIFFTEFNDGSRIVFPTGFHYVNDIQSQGGVTTLNGSLRYASQNDRWSVAAFGKNLTNRLIVSNNILGISTFGYPVGGTYKPPRTYGATFEYKF